MEVETLKKLKSNVEKCLEALGSKNDLNPAETKAAMDGLELLDMLKCEIENYKMEERYSEMGYSGEQMRPYRHYTVNAYKHPNMRYSGDYGVQGWYRSNDGAMWDPAYSDRGYGYSRHSIADRAVEKLENLMDQAGSEYEREELHRFIRMIRQAE